MQKGYIYQTNGAWHVRYRADGKQVSRKLADYNDQYRTKRSVRPLADEVLDPLNQGLQVNGPMTLQQYAETVYFPNIKTKKSPRRRCKARASSGTASTHSVVVSVRGCTTTGRQSKPLPRYSVTARVPKWRWNTTLRLKKRRNPLRCGVCREKSRKLRGIRFYLHLPGTVDGKQHKGPFMHRPDDDDSSAVTFWNTNMNDLQDLFCERFEGNRRTPAEESEGLARLFAVDLEGCD
jgi:hypothetical protein